MTHIACLDRCGHRHMNGMDFAAAINKKEKGGQADKEERSANHLDFVRTKRGNELGGKYCKPIPRMVVSRPLAPANISTGLL